MILLFEISLLLRATGNQLNLNSERQGKQYSRKFEYGGNIQLISHLKGFLKKCKDMGQSNWRQTEPFSLAFQMSSPATPY